MEKTARILFLLSLWFLFIGINYVSVYLSLYGFIWWLDILMHTWGGFLIVASWYLIRNIRAFPVVMSKRWLHPLIIIWVIMIVWELFEFKFGLITEHNYIADTIYDFINGFCGGLLSFLVFRFSTIKK
jgi:hypothetical protein